MYRGGNRHQGAKLIFGQLVILVLAFLVAGVAQADYKEKTKIVTPIEEDGIVKLVATLQDSPAFTDVVWKLYRLELPNYPVLVIPRHTAIVNLKPGDYRAVVMLKSTMRSRSFRLQSRSVEEIIIPMD